MPKCKTATAELARLARLLFALCERGGTVCTCLTVFCFVRAARKCSPCLTKTETARSIPASSATWCVETCTDTRHLASNLKVLRHVCLAAGEPGAGHESVGSRSPSGEFFSFLAEFSVFSIAICAHFAWTFTADEENGRKLRWCHQVHYSCVCVCVCVFACVVCRPMRVSACNPFVFCSWDEFLTALSSWVNVSPLILYFSTLHTAKLWVSFNVTKLDHRSQLRRKKRTRKRRVAAARD